MERIDPSKVGFVENVSPKDFREISFVPWRYPFQPFNSLAHIEKTAIYEGKPKPIITRHELPTTSTR